MDAWLEYIVTFTVKAIYVAIYYYYGQITLCSGKKWNGKLRKNFANALLRYKAAMPQVMGKISLSLLT